MLKKIFYQNSPVYLIIFACLKQSSNTLMVGLPKKLSVGNAEKDH